MSDIVFDKLYRFEAPDRVTARGMRDIRCYLFEAYRLTLPSWFSPNWENTQVDQDGRVRETVIAGERVLVPIKYQGKIVTRLDRWAKEKRGALTAYDKEYLGDVAARHHIQAGPVYFDFTNRFNWFDGDFGDEGSCFWGDREEARKLLEEAGVFAMRIYDPACAPQQLHGIGRAWVMPYSRYHVLFNGYMNHQLYGRAHTDDITFTLGLLFALFMDQDYRLVRLLNNGDDCGTIYINGARGIIVGQTEDIESIQELDLGIEEGHRDCYCSNCDNEMDEPHYCPDGDLVCGYCFDDLCCTCGWCNTTIWTQDAYYPDFYDDGLCARCYSRIIASCTKCDTEHWKSELRSVSEDWLCPDCWDEIATRCDRCLRSEYKDQIEKVDGQVCCKRCASAIRNSYTTSNKAGQQGWFELPI